jgi:hypothetical protein
LWKYFFQLLGPHFGLRFGLLFGLLFSLHFSLHSSRKPLPLGQADLVNTQRNIESQKRSGAARVVLKPRSGRAMVQQN